MTKESLMSTLKWIIGDILVPIAVGISAVYVAVQANRISELQALIAKSSEQPTFEVAQLHCARDEYYPEEDRIEISVLDGKYSNYRSDICTFLICNFYRDDGTVWTPIGDKELSMTAYYSGRENSNSLYGNIETWHSGYGYEEVEGLCGELAQYYANETTSGGADPVRFSASKQTFLEIAYTNLLGETETIYYLIDPHANRPVVRIDAEYGAQQFMKFAQMVSDGLCISPRTSSADVRSLLNISFRPISPPQ